MRIDLRALTDDKRVLRNPHKGWYHHFPDNHINKYQIAKDEDLLQVWDHFKPGIPWEE